MISGYNKHKSVTVSFRFIYLYRCCVCIFYQFWGYLVHQTDLDVLNMPNLDAIGCSVRTGGKRFDQIHSHHLARTWNGSMTNQQIWRVDLQNCLQTIWHVAYLQYSFSLVFRHKTYVRSRTNIILLYIMYISPIETLKFNNLDIRIFYEGYSLKNMWYEMSNMWYGL